MFKVLLVWRDAGVRSGFAVIPHIPVMPWIVAGTGCFDEPLVLVRGMVQDHVQQHSDVTLLAFGDKAIHIAHRAVLWIHRFVVRYVIPEIDLWRRIHRRDPDCVYTQMLQVVHPRGDSIQVPNTVSVGVLKRARVDFVNYGMLPPSAGWVCS